MSSAVRQVRVVIDSCTLTIESGVPNPAEIVMVERKGWCHPDTMADQLAEGLSRAYSRYTLERFGVVLHHNFDKLCLLGGSSDVRYGSGRMLSPVRVLVNGRAARSFGGQVIPVDGLIRDFVKEFFAARLPELEEHVRIELNVTSNPSPGAVATGNGVPERTVWFAPRSIDDLREQRFLLANDTSLGTGWAPEHPVESFVRDLVDMLSEPGSYRSERPWLGGDVKVMAYADTDEIDLVACVPQKCGYILSREAYLINRSQVLDECRRFARERFPATDIRIRLNNRDIPDRDELYLTYTGSSIESGDEGVVGRGNRVNGLITPLRPMNMEGANGKNPVYHAGKLYNLAAHRLAQRLHAATGDYAEVHLLSATGQRLDRPWRVVVQLATTSPVTDEVTALVREAIDGFPILTKEIIDSGVLLS